MREDLPPITTFLNRLLALTIDLQNTLFGVFEDLLRTRIEGAIASGTYDLGVETLTAESLIVTDRRTLYVHPQTGAETQVFTIRRRERNHPFTLADALERAGDPRARAAGQHPIRARRRAGPGAEPDARRRRGRTPRAAAAPDGAHRDPARRRWRRRIGRKPTGQPSPAPGRRNSPTVPAFTDSDLHIVTGLLLPIWKRLPDDSMRVYRLQTDAGERDHRPAGLTGLGGAGRRRRNADDRASRRLDRGARRPDGSCISRRAPASPRQGHGRIPGRAVRLHRRHGRSAEGDRPDLGDHLVEAAPVRADRREWSRRFSVR